MRLKNGRNACYRCCRPLRFNSGLTVEGATSQLEDVVLTRALQSLDATTGPVINPAWETADRCQHTNVRRRQWRSLQTRIFDVESEFGRF